MRVRAQGSERARAAPRTVCWHELPGRLLVAGAASSSPKSEFGLRFCVRLAIVGEFGWFGASLPPDLRAFLQYHTKTSE